MDQPADSALIAFVRRMHGPLVGGLSLYCGDDAAAEELAQDALVRVWERWSKVAQMRSPEAWTWTVALNLARSRFRRKGAERRALARFGPADIHHRDPDPADALAVRRQIAALPDRQRRALVLRYYADLPVLEVAALMGCAEGTVKSLTNRAIGTLRSNLGPAPTQEVTDHG